MFVDRKTPRRVTIVGIVPALGETDVREARPVIYRPFGADPPTNMTLIARLPSERDAAAVAARLRDDTRARRRPAALRDQDARRRAELAAGGNRVFGGMFAIFAGIAVLIASVGIYGVVSMRRRSALRRSAFVWRLALRARGCGGR